MASFNSASACNVATHPQQKCVFVSNKLPMTFIPSLAPQIGQLLSFLSSQNSEPVGPPYFRYRSIPHDMAGEKRAQIDVGFPVEADFKVQDSCGETVAEIGLLPAGRYVETNHIGAPETLVGATKMLLEYVKAESLELDVERNVRADGESGEYNDVWGGRFEWYQTDPTVEPDRSKWVTRLSIKLK